MRVRSSVWTLPVTPGLGYDDEPFKGPVTYCVVYDDGTEPVEAVVDFDRVMVLCREAAERGVPSAAYADATMVYRHNIGDRIGTVL